MSVYQRSNTPICANMKISNTPISGLKLIEFSRFEDQRGFLVRLFCEDTLSSVLNGRKINQINHTKTKLAGTLRGMHYQRAPHAEMKIIKCIKGRVWDVAIDLRSQSETFLQYFAVELSEENSITFAIPEGFAHGFQTMEPNSEMIYFHTSAYNVESEGGVRYDDPRIGIRWPLEPVSISDKDTKLQLLDSSFVGIL